MTKPADKWGIVSTIKAPAAQILDFAAYHLEAGAHRLFLYLDTPCPEARNHLEDHPKIRVIDCDDAYWSKRGRSGRPQKHQMRQTRNAARCYNRQSKDLDWLAHIDVDEFLWSAAPIAQRLSQLDAQIICARSRPLEAIAGSPDLFKAYLPPGPDQDQILRSIYPRFADQSRGGFLSHVQGKLFVRTGQEDASFRIHNFFQGEIENPAACELSDIDLCHFHASNWEDWLAHYHYRLQQGSYRAELAPQRRWDKNSPNLHSFLLNLERNEGQTGLRTFFDELNLASPLQQAKLETAGLLRRRSLRLNTKREKHFPGFFSKQVPAGTQ